MTNNISSLATEGRQFVSSYSPHKNSLVLYIEEPKELADYLKHNNNNREGAKYQQGKEKKTQDAQMKYLKESPIGKLGKIEHKQETISGIENEVNNFVIPPKNVEQALKIFEKDHAIPESETQYIREQQAQHTRLNGVKDCFRGNEVSGGESADNTQAPNATGKDNSIDIQIV